VDVLNLLRGFGVEVNEFLTSWCACGFFVVRAEAAPDAAGGFGGFVCDTEV